MQSNLIQRATDSGVLHLTMNRPDVHNAFDEHLVSDLTAALESASVDPSIRVVVLGGEGRSFSAGGDLDYMRRMGGYTFEQNLEDARSLARLMSTLDQLDKPTIARVHGAEFGGGVGLVSCCVIAIACSSALFALSEVRIGLIPATIAPYVIRSVGVRAARRYFQTAERFDAHTAHRIGILHEVVEADELDEKIDTLVSSILRNSPAAMTAAKQAIPGLSAAGIDAEMIEHSARLIAGIRDSAEGREGLDAFLEKREPSWVR